MAGKFFEMFVKIEWEGGSFSGSIYPDARKFCLFEGVATPSLPPLQLFPTTTREKFNFYSSPNPYPPLINFSLLNRPEFPNFHRSRASILVARLASRERKEKPPDISDNRGPLQLKNRSAL